MKKIKVGELLDELRQRLLEFSKEGLAIFDKFDELEKELRKIGKKEIKEKGKEDE